MSFFIFICLNIIVVKLNLCVLSLLVFLSENSVIRKHTEIPL
jgi:hypothetical protein